MRRGEDVELICEVEHEPAAAINWRRLDAELPLGARTYGNSLRIPNVQTGGEYLCTATTRQGVFEYRYGFVIRGENRFCYALCTLLSAYHLWVFAFLALIAEKQQTVILQR